MQKQELLKTSYALISFINGSWKQGKGSMQAGVGGCKRAFIEDWGNFYLESDHLDSFWGWRNSSLEGVHPDHASIVQQLNQRQADRNFNMESLDMGLGPIEPRFMDVHEKDLNPLMENATEIPEVDDGAEHGAAIGEEDIAGEEAEEPNN
ncbi:hypothetical protein ACET3Z_011669 [Daucus carota]